MADTRSGQLGNGASTTVPEPPSIGSRRLARAKVPAPFAGRSVRRVRVEPRLCFGHGHRPAQMAAIFLASSRGRAERTKRRFRGGWRPPTS